MSVRSLGYVIIGAADVAAWHSYSANILGAQVESHEGGLLLRVDSRAWRIAIEPSDAEDVIAIGWEVGGPDALTAVMSRLNSAKIDVTIDDALAERRGVRGLARFLDPAGVCGELFWGATERFEKPFVSPVGVSGFVTGDQGVGHVVLSAPDPKAMHEFYAGLLGFRISDFIDMPVGPDRRIPVEFMHCNSRHHTLAFAPAPPPKKLIHFMLQVLNLDDVGLALDRVARHGARLSLTLGRHVNDHMLSFYAVTPSGFEVEYGWGAREIDDATWLPVRHDRTSFWGHAPVDHPETSLA